MGALSQTVIRKFCEHCDWTHQCWLLRKHLFDENPAPELLQLPFHSHFFRRLSVILQEYWLHEVAKLHDPAVQSGQINLSVEYILLYGGWPPDVFAALTALKERLSGLAQDIKGARNKLLSHNDLAVILSGNDLGTFEEGVDVAYFQALQEFANLVHDHVIGGPFPFDGLTTNDVHVFMSAFGKGVA